MLNWTKHFYSLLLICWGIALGSEAMASAPLCSSVFSETKIIQAVEDLAQMRMTLDVAKSSGSPSSAIKLLAKRYPEKYKELLQLTHSEELLKKLVQEKILELQGLKKEVIEEELVKRDQEQAIDIAKNRKFKQRITLDFEPSASMEYLAESHSILAKTMKGNTVLIDVQSAALTYPLGEAATTNQSFISPSRKQITLLSKTEISIYDLLQRKMISQKTLQGPATEIFPQQKLAWNPLHTKFAFMTEEGLAILDAATGVSNLVFPMQLKRSTISSLIYINNNEIAILLDWGPTHLIYDSSTGQSREFNNVNLDGYSDLERLADGAISATNKSQKKTLILDAKDLQAGIEVRDLRGAELYHNSGMAFDESLPDASVIDLKNPEKGWFTLQGFGKFYFTDHPKEIINSVTVNGDNILVATRERAGKDEKKNYFIDIWSTEPR
jgi:hypothetical protein